MPDPREASNPLSDAQIAKLRRARATANQAQLDIQKACQCGLDMRGEQAVCDALCERIDAILTHYGGERKNR